MEQFPRFTYQKYIAGTHFYFTDWVVPFQIYFYLGIVKATANNFLFIEVPHQNLPILG